MRKVLTVVPFVTAALLVVGISPVWGQNHNWSKRFGDTNSDQGVGIAVDGARNVLVTGQFGGTVDFGGGPLMSADANDIFVAKYDASGTHLWSKGFGGIDGSDIGFGIAVDGARNVLVTGTFGGPVDFGGGPLTSAGGSDIFIATYDASGAHVWSKRFGDLPGFDSGFGIAVDEARNVLVTGVLVGTVDFGGGPLTSAGGLDIFIAKFEEIGGGQQPPGDSNQDGAIDLSDGVAFLNWFFLDIPLPAPAGSELCLTDPAGATAVGLLIMDWNGDVALDVSDATGLLTWFFDGAAEHDLGQACIPIQSVDCISSCVDSP